MSIFAPNRKKLFNNDKKGINCLLMKELFKNEYMKNLKDIATFINKLIFNFDTYNLVKKSKPVQDTSLI